MASINVEQFLENARQALETPAEGASVSSTRAQWSTRLDLLHQLWNMDQTVADMVRADVRWQVLLGPLAELSSSLSAPPVPPTERAKEWLNKLCLSYRSCSDFFRSQKARRGGLCYTCNLVHLCLFRSLPVIPAVDLLELLLEDYAAAPTRWMALVELVLLAVRGLPPQERSGRATPHPPPLFPVPRATQRAQGAGDGVETEDDGG